MSVTAKEIKTSLDEYIGHIAFCKEELNEFMSTTTETPESDATDSQLLVYYLSTAERVDWNAVRTMRCR